MLKPSGVSIDATTKRFYPGIIGGLLLAVAYFQGSGISALIAEQLPSPAPPTKAGSHSTLGVTRPPRDGAPILKRNPFDSVTGQLFAKPSATASQAPPPAAAPKLSDGALPECATTTVSVISSADDPAFSFAVIKSGSQAQMRRIGDSVDGKQVEAIDETRVVLATGDDRCQVAMRKDGAGSVGQELPAPTEREPATPGNKSKLGEGITKVSDTSFIIEENGAQKLAQIRDGFMRSAKLVDGEGVRLYRSAQTTILGQLGLKKGDMVKTLNGFDMSSVDQSTQAYSAIKTADAVAVTIVRDGKEMKLDYQVKK